MKHCEARLGLYGPWRIRDQERVEFAIEAPRDGPHAVGCRTIHNLGVLEDMDAKSNAKLISSTRDSSNVNRPAVTRSDSGAGQRTEGAPGTRPAVPDYIQPVVGWRTWVWDERHGLVSPLGWTRWMPGETQRASCSPTTWMRAQRILGRPHVPAHNPPGSTCECGIYACSTPPSSTDLFLKGHVFVVGLVSLWGRIVEHEHGWRGEFAYPRVLFSVREVAGVNGRASERQAARCLAELHEFMVPVATVASYADLGAPAPVAQGSTLPLGS